MCLAKAYLGAGGEKDLLAEEIVSVKAGDGKLRLTTLFGEQKEIEASITEIDFRASSLFLEKLPG
jgi:predicted RNA-binding protein